VTPARLQAIIDQCRGRRGGAVATYRDLARFLGVQPITLRRWLSGERPVPRAIELLFEIHYAWPEINAASVQRLIDERDRKPAED
jgi:transcriptional regulator with XRE-family HTH domain